MTPVRPRDPSRFAILLLAVLLVGPLVPWAAAQPPPEDPAPTTSEPAASGDETAEEPNLSEKASAAAGAQIEKGSDQVEEKVDEAWTKVGEIWNHEITSIDDQPITVAKIIVALVLLIFGYLASRHLSRILDRRLLSRFVDRAAAAILKTLSFYAFLAAFVFFALDIVGIPLTVFTFLGGILAIGIGFGSQNVVNNFISGLILMFERPIKVGDLVDVEGTQGVVEQIGARSTRVRSGNNTHIIVPNSSFLEKNVLNWTISDDQIRTYVDVGVAYGSPTKKTAELMKKAAEEASRTLARPSPEVLFTEFGDNSLGFRVYFWLKARAPLDRLRAESEVRFKIDDLFREADIVISFPQRDVHIDSLSPVEVRLLDRDRSDREGS